MTMKPAVLAIDQGGHASRAFLVSPAGELLYTSYHEVDTSYGAPDRVEHDARQMLDSVHCCLADVAGHIEASDLHLLCAGLATQRSSIVCWDRNSGQPLTPVISWQDRRNAAWIERYRQHDDLIHRLTGLYSTAHYGVSKLRWCFDHIPDVARAHARGELAWGPMASWLLFNLIDDHPLLVDSVNASRTLLWGLSQHDWHPQLLELFGFDRQYLPRCMPNVADFGQLCLGQKHVPFTIMTGDQSAALFAYGEPDRDAVFINMGTGAFVQRLYDGDIDYTPRLLASVVHHDGESALYALEGTVNGAGSAFVVVEQELGMDTAEAQAGLPGWMRQYRDPPLYLNGVSGLGSPYWDAGFTSEFVGAGTSEEKLVAVAESIAFLISVNLQEMNRFLSPAQKIVLTGGLANIDPLCQLLADLNQRPVCRPAAEEATAMGLAFLLSGRPRDWPGISDFQLFQPQIDPALQQRFATWQELMEQHLFRLPA